MDGGTYLKILCFGDEYLAKVNSASERAAKRFNVEFENLAEQDTSNSRIHKQIVKTLIKLPNPQEHVFLIGWTSPLRLDAEYEGKYFTYRNDKANYDNILMNKLHKYDHYVFDRIVVSQRWTSIVYGVQQMLESMDVKYYMFNTQTQLDFNSYTEKVLRNLNHKYYFDAIGVKSTMVNYLKAKGHKFNTHQDLSISAHDDYGKFLAQKLRSSGIIERPQ